MLTTPEAIRIVYEMVADEFPDMSDDRRRALTVEHMMRFYGILVTDTEITLALNPSSL